MDAEGLLRRCVILGFCADGDHFVSYSVDQEGRHDLQIWTFSPAGPATLLASVPAFRTDESDSPDSLGGGGASDSFVSESPFDPRAGALDHLRISVCESPGRDVLVAHAEAEPTAPFSRGGAAPAARRCFVTAVPSPAFRDRAATRANLRATHASYLSTADVPFQPAWFTEEEEEDEERNERNESPAAASTRRAHFLVLNAGDALVGVRLDAGTEEPLGAARAMDDDGTSASERPEALDDARPEARLSFAAGPSSRVRWRGDAGSGFGDEEEPTSTGARARVVRMRAWTALDADATLARALGATLRDGAHSLVDFETHVVRVAPSGGDFFGGAYRPSGGARASGASAAAAVTSVLRVREATDSAPRAPRFRAVASVASFPLRFPSAPGNEARLLFSVEVRAPRGGWGAASGAGTRGRGRGGTHGVIAALRARLAAYRRATRVPSGRRVVAAAAMTNARAVASGESAAVIKHPTLPVCVLGWGWRGGGDG